MFVAGPVITRANCISPRSHLDCLTNGNVDSRHDGNVMVLYPHMLVLPRIRKIGVAERVIVSRDNVTSKVVVLS